MHYFITNISKKRELQQTEFNYSADIDFIKYDFLQNIYCKTIFVFGK